MSETRPFDVIVVGGGATGAGVLRDLARRGLRSLLVERGDYGTGTTGRYHGLLHSGGRYAMRDSQAARECIVENRILRRIAPASIEATGGYFVATPDDPEDYVDGFPAACAAAGIECEEIPVLQALAREPALNPKIRRVFRVPDGSVEPWNLIEANLADEVLELSAWPTPACTAARPGRTTASSASNGQGTASPRRRSATRAPAPPPGSPPGSWSRPPAPGPAGSRLWPASSSRCVLARA